MAVQLMLGDIPVDVTLKDIKNIHLSVYPPTGKVRISAPMRMNLDLIRVYAISRLGWIRQQQLKLQGQERETPRDYVERESHYLWGRRYLLKLIEVEAAPSVEIRHNRICLKVRPGADKHVKQAVIEAWYRDRIRQAIAPLFLKWEPLIGVTVNRIFIQQMKTKWGSCSPTTGNIRLNTELAKKPRECLEYILVHEMVHLLEPTHNARFVALMDRFMPSWQYHRDALNQLPLRYEHWTY